MRRRKTSINNILCESEYLARDGTHDFSGDLLPALWSLEKHERELALEEDDEDELDEDELVENELDCKLLKHISGVDRPRVSTYEDPEPC